jgi:hypothetical protein
MKQKKQIKRMYEMLRAKSNEELEEEEELRKSTSIEKKIMMMKNEAYHKKAIRYLLNEDNRLLIPYLYHLNAKNQDL